MGQVTSQQSQSTSPQRTAQATHLCRARDASVHAMPDSVCCTHPSIHIAGVRLCFGSQGQLSVVSRAASGRGHRKAAAGGVCGRRGAAGSAAGRRDGLRTVTRRIGARSTHECLLPGDLALQDAGCYADSRRSDVCNQQFAPGNALSQSGSAAGTVVQTRTRYQCTS